MAGFERRRAPQLDELVGAYPNYNEQEEERRYYRRKRLGVLKNVLAASAGGMLTYGVYLGRRPAAPRGLAGWASGHAVPPRARRGGTAWRVLRWDPSLSPSPRAPLPRPEVSQGKRNLGASRLPSSFTSSAPSQLQLRPPHMGGRCSVPGAQPQAS